MERMEEKSENSQICPELGTEMGCGQDTVPNSEQQMKDELEISIQSGTPYLPGQKRLFHLAMSLRSQEIFNLLIQSGRDIHELTEGDTLLHYACRCGDEMFIPILIDAGLDVNAKGAFGYTPLDNLYLLKPTNPRLFEMLLGAGADPNQYLENNLGCFNRAAWHGNIDLVRLFLKYHRPLPIVMGDYRINVLHSAALGGHLDIVKLLLDYGLHVDEGLEDGISATHTTVVGYQKHIKVSPDAPHQYADILAYLLSRGADPNSLMMNESSVLHKCVQCEFVEGIKILIKNGADINIVSKQTRKTPLHLANSVEMVEILLSFNPDVNLQNSNGDTFLNTASLEGSPEIVSRLLAAGANHAITDKDGFSPLHCACQFGKYENVVLLLDANADMDLQSIALSSPLHVTNRPDIMSLLLTRGANPNLQDCDGATPLHIACSARDSDLIGILLSHGSDVHLEDESGNTPLLLLCEGGRPGDVIKLLNAGSAINHQNEITASPLTIAIKAEQIEIVKTLLDFGADISLQDWEDNTPASLVAAIGNLEIFEMLVSLGAVDSEEESLFCLRQAATHGHLILLQYLLNREVDSLLFGNFLRTALHMAALKDRDEIVSYLLSRGVDVDCKNDDDQTALHIACSTGGVKSITLLLNAGANLESRDRSDCTPVQEACGRGHLEAASLLISRGADVHVIDEEFGQTLLHHATSAGDPQLVSLILSHGVPINTPCTKPSRKFWNIQSVGDTPLHHASRHGHLEIMDILLEFGANINCVNQEGMTPLHLVCRRQHLQGMELFLENGADFRLKNQEGFTPFDIATKRGGTLYRKMRYHIYRKTWMIFTSSLASEPSSARSSPSVSRISPQLLLASISDLVRYLAEFM